MFIFSFRLSLSLISGMAIFRLALFCVDRVNILFLLLRIDKTQELFYEKLFKDVISQMFSYFPCEKNPHTTRITATYSGLKNFPLIRYLVLGIT